MQNSNLKKVFIQILEPFALGLLALLFIIPSITVLNLSPITKKLEKLNVLGVTTGENLSITLVEGKHNIFSQESLDKVDGSYEYFSKISKREADSYSKPILKIENKNGEDVLLSFYGQTKNNTNSNIYLKIGDSSYKIQDDKGFTYPQEISLKAGSSITVFLSIESFKSVQFADDFNLTITEKSSI